MDDALIIFWMKRNCLIRLAALAHVEIQQHVYTHTHKHKHIKVITVQGCGIACGCSRHIFIYAILFGYCKYSLVCVSWKPPSLRAKLNYRAMKIINYIWFEFNKKQTFFEHGIYKSSCLLTKELKSYNIPPHGILISLKTAGLGRKLINTMWSHFLSHSMPFVVMKATFLKTRQ